MSQTKARATWLHEGCTSRLQYVGKLFSLLLRTGLPISVRNANPRFEPHWRETDNMREALEAVAEFLAHHGALDDYDAILQSMHKMGWEIEEDRPARWRSFLAVMRAELSVVDEPINYVFLFERLLQLYVRIPIDICRRLFASKIILHLIVERFAAAFENIDAEVFKLESDILCHTENIYGVCMLIQDKLYSGNNNSSSSLGAFLSEFSALFDDDEPKDAWDAFRREHRLSGTTFRRDMKRALWWIEQQVFGKTEVELLFPTDSVFEKSTTISRRFLETKFGGSSHEWRALSDVFSIPGLGPERPTDTDAIEDDELVSETPPLAEGEDRVWSARLPIAPPTADADSSSDSEANAEMDRVVRQSLDGRPPSPAPFTPASRQRRPSPPRRASVSPPRRSAPAHSPVRRAAPSQKQAKRRRDEEIEDISDDEPRGRGGRSNSGAAQESDYERRQERRPANKRKRKTKIYWTQPEVDALVKGIKQFGKEHNLWILIKEANPELLRKRTNVDLKDKYRNLVKAGKIPPIGE